MMSGNNIRRSMPLFPIGIVMQLTELSARQIRYYEEHQLNYSHAEQREIVGCFH